MFNKPKPPPDHSLRWNWTTGLSAHGIPAIVAACLMFVAATAATGVVIVVAPQAAAAIVKVWVSQ